MYEKLYAKKYGNATSTIVNCQQVDDLIDLRASHCTGQGRMTEAEANAMRKKSTRANIANVLCCAWQQQAQAASFIAYSYCVPLFRVQQRRHSDILPSLHTHSKEMHKYLCALHSIGLFRSGSHPHFFCSPLLPLLHLSSLQLFIFFLRTYRQHDRSFVILD